MSPAALRSDVKQSVWAPYEPSPEAPWNLRRVVHLHRRTGFAATWKELHRDLAEGPGPSIARVLTGQVRQAAVPDEFAYLADLLADEAVRAGDIGRLQGWWIYRMLWGPDPLGERLTLLWHNHFATSNLKVQYPQAMRQQNAVFRRYARAPFGELLRAAVHDPALLLWLDAPVNRKGRPNENLARELMELFTLGIGHYSETDVREAARALTGWDVVQDAFRESRVDHDAGAKTILGQSGFWKGDDLLRLLLEHPATSRRLAWRLCQMLMGEGSTDDSALEALAAGLRAHHLDIGWAVATIVRSQAFFAEKNLGNRILGPLEYLVGTARALECLDPPPSTRALAEWAAHLGQELFYPPNVGGWKEGRAWLAPRFIIARANYASALAQGHLSQPPVRIDWHALAQRHGHSPDMDGVLNFYPQLLTGAAPSPAWRKRLEANLGRAARPMSQTVALAVALIVASPEAQLA